MRKKTFLAVLIVLFITAVALVFLNRHRNLQSSILKPNTSTHQRMRQPQYGKTGPPELYPNPKLTPGDVLNVDKVTVCKTGYTKGFRLKLNLSEARSLFLTYRIEYPDSKEGREEFEIDHFIPLELGGSNDLLNLWPEPADPKPGFHEKDGVEHHLHSLVCKGAITLEEAQREIKTDWYAVYLQMRHTK